MSFTAELEPSEYYMYYSRNGDYWLHVSTIGCVYPTVMVYDSKYRTVNKKSKLLCSIIALTGKLDCNLLTHKCNVEDQTVDYLL